MKSRPRYRGSEIDAVTQIEVWDRDGGRCVRCKGRGQLGLHHVIPRDMGGSDEARNLVTLCRHCHDNVEAETQEKQHGLSWGELTAQVTEPKQKPKYKWYRDERGFLICEEL